MSLRQWLLAVAIVMAGCATAHVSDKDVARLPASERTQLSTAQRSIDVAKSNLAAARVARDEAKQFRKIAISDVDSAKTRLEAARSSVDLGKSSRDDQTLREAARNEDAARDQLMAARAKLDYADRLVELRELKIDEGDANLTAARADVEVTKLQLAQRNGMAADVDARKLEAKKQDAQERLAETRAKVAQTEGDVVQLKMAWDDRRHEMSTASRGGPGAAPAEVPMP
ncbi:MAG: hypothetical protein ACXVDD_15545, partial [Polyangia bacterium]